VEDARGVESLDLQDDLTEQTGDKLENVSELKLLIGNTTNRETLEHQLAFAIKTAPKLTIQGGTTEVLRGIIARGLGLR